MLEILSWLSPFFNSLLEFDLEPFIWFSTIIESLLLAQRPIGTILVLKFLMVCSASTSQETGLLKKRGKEVQKNEMS